MMSRVQQMLRVDREDVRPLDEAPLEAALAIIPGILEDADAVVLSDYGKGCSPRRSSGPRSPPAEREFRCS